MLGSDAACRSDIMMLRPHPGALKIAKWLRALMAQSPIRESHRDYDIDGEIQDPYNLRCAPQILGACDELIEEAATTFEREANSVTDNPLLLPNSADQRRHTDIVSGGHFHGMPVAIRLYNLVQAMGIMARLSNMRCVRYVDEARNKGLGSDLIWPGLSSRERSVSSGMMIPEYASAALTNELWGLSMPSHLFSLSTDAGQEDHVSMSATLACRINDMLPRLSEVLAIELAFAHQAAAIRAYQRSLPSKRKPAAPSLASAKKIAEIEAELAQQKEARRFIPKVQIEFGYRLTKRERRLSPISEKLLQRIRRIFPTVRKDRELAPALHALADSVRSGALAAAVPERLWIS